MSSRIQFRVRWQWPAIVMFCAAAGCSDPQLEKDLEQARALTRRWVERLDSQTTDSGSYIRHQGERLADQDPWGNPLRVGYSRGGVSEVVKVSSSGPDQKFDTDDDVFEERATANLAGVGEGIKENIGEVAENAAAGTVKGTIKGLKEGIRDNLPKLPGKKDEAAAGDEPAAVE
jgi:hypothetical protein